MDMLDHDLSRRNNPVPDSCSMTDADVITLREKLAFLQHDIAELKKVIRAYDKAINALPRDQAIPLIDAIAKNYGAETQPQSWSGAILNALMIATAANANHKQASAIIAGPPVI